MTPPRVLLIGGHGKVSQLLTPLILARNWHLTSMIRSPDQRSTINSLKASHPGTLDVLISSIDDIKSQANAQSIIDSTTPTYIVWSAGAGGKGEAERTFAIDRDACIAFARAAAATKTVEKFLVVSYLGSRRRKAPWWSEEDWKACQEVNDGALKNYYKAKVAADEALTALGKTARGGDGKGFAAISLRPGTLTDDEGEGRIKLGKLGSRGQVRRGDVARVAVELLERDVESCWLDLLEGDDVVSEAVDKCMKDDVDCVEGEDVDAMIKEYT